MAALSQALKDAIRKEIGKRYSERRSPWPLNKADTDAMIATTDNWQDTNAAAFNTALPTAAKNNCTTPQKNEVFEIVAHVRYSGAI